MRVLAKTVFAGCVAASLALPQAKPFPSYKSHEDYCAANPKMPTCIKLDGPINVNTSVMSDEQREAIRKLAAGGSGRSVSPTVSRPRQRMNAVPVTLTGGKPDWRFAHPNAAMLMSINLRALLNSPVMETALSQISGQLLAQIPGLNPSDLAKARTWMNNVDRIYVSVYSPSSTPQAVVLITGRFDQAFLSSLQLDPAAASKLVNASAVLIGDDVSLSQATRRLAAATAPGALAQSAEAWATRYDFWMMGTPALLASASAGMKKTAGVPDFASSVRSFSIGMTLSSDMRLDVVLDATSPQVAEQLAAVIRSGQLQQPGMQEYAKNMRVETHGTALQISTVVDQKQLSRGMGARMSKGGSYVSAPVLVTEPNPNAKPDRVVISGLDDGPKEIKLDGKK